MLPKLSSQPPLCTSSTSAIFAATYTLTTNSSQPPVTLSLSSLALTRSPSQSNPSHNIEPFTQFDSYLTTWTTSNALGSRTLGSLTKFLLDQYGDMPTENAPRGGNAFYVGKYGKGKARTRTKAKARTTTKANAGLNATGGTLTTLELHCPHLPRLLRHHRPNTLESPRTPARSSQPNTTPQDPTVTAGSTDGFFPIPATSAKESSNLTTRHASTQHLLPVPPRLETLTLNPRIQSWWI
jgi:hypothetical protein